MPRISFGTLNPLSILSRSLLLLLGPSPAPQILSLSPQNHSDHHQESLQQPNSCLYPPPKIALITAKLPSTTPKPLSISPGSFPSPPGPPSAPQIILLSPQNLSHHHQDSLQCLKFHPPSRQGPSCHGRRFRGDTTMVSPLSPPPRRRSQNVRNQREGRKSGWPPGTSSGDGKRSE